MHGSVGTLECAVVQVCTSIGVLCDDVYIFGAGLFHFVP